MSACLLACSCNGSGSGGSPEQGGTGGGDTSEAGQASATGGSSGGGTTSLLRATVVEADDVREVELDAEALYWTWVKNDGPGYKCGLMRAERDGSNATALWEGSFAATGLVADDDALYVGDPGSGSPSTGTIVRIPKAGGPAVELIARSETLYSVAGVSGARNLALDDDNVYFVGFASATNFSNNEATVMFVAKTGGPAEALATGRSITGLAATGGEVFFASYESARANYVLQAVSTAGAERTLDQSACSNPVVQADSILCATFQGLSVVKRTGGAATPVIKSGNTSHFAIVGADVFLASAVNEGVFHALLGSGVVTATRFCESGSAPTAIVADSELVAFTDSHDNKLRIVVR